MAIAQRNLPKSATERARAAAGRAVATARTRAERRPGVGRGPVLTPKRRSQWERDGFLFIPRFFSRDEVRALADHMDELWRERHRPDNPVVIDVFGLDDRPPRRYFRDVPDEARSVVHKLNDLFLVDGGVRALALHPRLVALLSELIDGDPCVCNSLSFQYGSEQPYHFDTWYMPPPVENKLVVSFIAFDPIDAGNGPLQYYPGSHRMPPYRFSHGGLNSVPHEEADASRHTEAWLAERSIRPEQIRCRPGDLFLWHAQLFHGGAPIADHSRTRRSLVTHYWRTEDLDPAEVAPGPQAGHYLQRNHQPVPEAAPAD